MPPAPGPTYAPVAPACGETKLMELSTGTSASANIERCAGLVPEGDAADVNKFDEERERREEDEKAEKREPKNDGEDEDDEAAIAEEDGGAEYLGCAKLTGGATGGCSTLMVLSALSANPNRPFPPPTYKGALLPGSNVVVKAATETGPPDLLSTSRPAMMPLLLGAASGESGGFTGESGREGTRHLPSTASKNTERCKNE